MEPKKPKRIWCKDSRCRVAHPTEPDPHFPNELPFWTCDRIAWFWSWAEMCQLTQEEFLELRLFFLRELFYADLSERPKRAIHEF
jgi:hypothetical protein